MVEAEIKENAFIFSRGALGLVAPRGNRSLVTGC